jgi:hypothetical protein
MSRRSEKPWFVKFAFYFVGWVVFHYLEHAIGLYFGWRFFLDPDFSFFDTLFGAVFFSAVMAGADFFFQQRREPE